MGRHSSVFGGIAVLVWASAAAGPLHEMACAENPFSYFGADAVPIPQAASVDF